MNWIIATGGMSFTTGLISIVAAFHGAYDDAFGCGFWSIFEAICCVYLIAASFEETQP